MDYQKTLESVLRQVRSENLGGEVASYIPELAKIPAEKFGMHLTTLEGANFATGDSEKRFSIQSISKVFLLARAVQLIGKDLRKRVGVEPSGSLFNSLVLLEYEKGLPRNPFINAGALVVSDILVSLLPDPKNDYLHFVGQLAGSEDIDYDQNIIESELALSFRNRAILNMMKGFGNIENDTEEVLDFYVTACSLSLNCRELSNAFTVFANRGRALHSGKSFLSESQAKRINATMLTCGLYDEAGEFAFRVGLVAKSGVGGGIAAIYPGEYAVSVWSPPLNPKGNSHAGFRALELLTDLTESSIF